MSVRNITLKQQRINMKEMNIAVRDELQKLASTGMSVSSIAQSVGFSRQQVSKWLQLKGNVRRMSAGVIADRLNLEIKFNQDMTACEFTKREESEASHMDNRLQNHLLDEIESLKALNTELINQVKTLESQPPRKFDWTESNMEKFAVELNADSTFQEIANELHIKSEQWNYLFKNINQPLGISRKGIIRDVNEMYVEQFGYNRDELIGKPILDFIHPDEHKELKEVIASEKSDKIWRVMKKNGHYCKVRVQRQNFGDPDAGFSVTLMECVDEDCTDID